MITAKNPYFSEFAKKSLLCYPPPMGTRENILGSYIQTVITVVVVILAHFYCHIFANHGKISQTKFLLKEEFPRRET